MYLEDLAMIPLGVGPVFGTEFDQWVLEGERRQRSRELRAAGKSTNGLCYLAAGWIEPDRPVPQGDVPDELVARLKAYRGIDLPPEFSSKSMGSHTCGFCPVTEQPASAVMQADFRSAPGYNDSGEIIVPSRLATYVAPTMIGHYIRRHGYCPPVEFIAAVLDGPHPGSAEWFELAIDRGLYRRYVVECISFHQNLSRVPALLREQLRANYYSVCYSLKTDEALAEFFGLPFESQLELLGWRQRRWWEFWSDRPGRVVSSAS